MSARVMMATKAYHKLGDISSDKPNFCLIFSETEDCYIGRWMEGFGFINVSFPKATTRELTPEEQARADRKLSSPLIII